MVWQIALGILLGYLLIGFLPVITELLNTFLNWVFDIFSNFFGFLSKFYKDIIKTKWYYKVLIFILGSYFFIYWNWFDMLSVWFLLFGIYFLLWLFDKWHKLCEKIERRTVVKKK